MSPRPSRGDIWLADLNPTRGHEQAGVRPVVVLSADRLNASPALRVIAAPLTPRETPGVPWHVNVQPPDGGVRQPLWIKCEDVRSLSLDRFISHWGKISGSVMAEVEDSLRVLLQL